MMPRRVPMEVRLRPQSLPTGFHLRPVREADREDLAILLYAAYRGTVDDEGETLADALAEIERLFAGDYGEFLSDCSFVFEEGEFITSASLITWWPPHDAPLVAFTMTRPEARRTGQATRLLKASMNALLDRGYDRLTLIVTDGNVEAQRLYARLGFRELRSDP
jgi:ribosomal protein S18 acetylase RimI-like enzyme